MAERPVLLAIVGSVGGGQDLDGVMELLDADGVAIGPSLPRVDGGHGPRQVREPTVNGVELGRQVVVTEIGASLIDVVTAAW